MLNSYQKKIKYLKINITKEGKDHGKEIIKTLKNKVEGGTKR